MAPAAVCGPCARSRRVSQVKHVVGRAWALTAAAAAWSFLPRLDAAATWFGGRAVRACQSGSPSPPSRSWKSRLPRQTSAGIVEAPRLTDAGPREVDGDLFSWLTGGSEEAFKRGAFGREWTLTRGASPGILLFSVSDCLELVNDLHPQDHDKECVAYNGLYNLLMNTSADVDRLTVPEALGTARGAQGFMRCKSVAMIRTDFEYHTYKKTNHSQIADFMRERSLRCADDLASHGEGWTFILNLVNRASKHLTSTHHALWASFGLSGGFNAYLTPPESQGLQLHSDPHDVFVLQQAGSKVWALFEHGTHKPIAEVILDPGDVLYLPAGLPHLVKNAGNEPSLHVAASVFRGFFTCAGILAAWLELAGRAALPEAVHEGAGDIEALRRRLARLGGPWDRMNQLPASHQTLTMLRALDLRDVPDGLQAAVAADLVVAAAELVPKLFASEAPEDVGLAGKLQGLLALSEAEQVHALMDVFFAIREYRWVSHYSIHQPKDLGSDNGRVALPLAGARFRRRTDASALISATGALYLNGYRFSDLPEGEMAAARFSLSLAAGAAGREFGLEEVPGSREEARVAVQRLVRYDGLAILS